MVLPGEYEVDDSGFVIKMLTWHCSSNTGNNLKTKTKNECEGEHQCTSCTKNVK